MCIICKNKGFQTFYLEKNKEILLKWKKPLKK